MLDILLLNCIEPGRFELSNFAFRNNNISSNTQIITPLDALVSITDMIAENNLFDDSSFIYTLTFDSVLISNSSISNLTLQGASYFVYSNCTDAAKNFIIEYGYFDSSSGNGYAQVRPFIIYNTSFSVVTLSSNAVLLASSNPNIIIQKNIFEKISSDSSQIMNLGDTQDFYSSVTVFSDFASDSLLDITITETEIFTTAENKTFINLFFLSALYQSTRSYISQIDPQNGIYFICIAENSFDSIFVTNSSESLILLQNFQLSNSSINISSNSFNNITADSSYDIMAANSINRLYLVNNQINNTNSEGYAFSYVSSAINYVILNSTSMSDTNQLGLYKLQATQCNQIITSNNQARNLEFSQVFVAVDCSTITEDFIFQNSTFENIALKTSGNEIDTIRFIALDFAQASDQSHTYIHFSV